MFMQPQAAHQPQQQPQPPLANNEEEYENDSDLNGDLNIDDAGNVLPPTGENPWANGGQGGEMLTNTGAMAHILAGYGANICEQLVEEFIKLEFNTKQLSALTDPDLQQLGIADAGIRRQMLSEFAELPHQEYVPPTYGTADEQRVADGKSNALVLNNVYKHLNSLKTSLSVVLLRLYVRPSENVLINDHMYASTAVLRTLDEFNRSVVAMEKRLLDMQYGNIRPPAAACAANPSSAKRRRFWFAFAGGLCSVGSLLAMRYMHMLKR